MQQDFIKNNNKQFKQLTFAITKRQEPALVVINIANENAKKYVKQEIEKQFPNYTNYDIELTGVNFGSLTNHLLRNLPESVTKSKTIKDVIHITGLKNHALEIKNDDNNELIFEASEVIKQINFERSRIFKEIPAILILYIDNYTYRKLLEAASDFLDWVNYYFKFESNETESYTEEYKEEVDYKPEPHYTPERKIKIKDLKQKLEKLDSNKLPEQRFFRTQINLQFALARELSEVREFEKSNKHLQNALNTINKYK